MWLKNKQRKGIKTQAVFVKNNQVFFRKNKKNAINDEEWQPVAIQWVSV
ncbi:hypothetical protein [uncultured Maribacter sp.]|nr:hypothetical protein [uncultured Maribacter sp.]